MFPYLGWNGLWYINMFFLYLSIHVQLCLISFVNVSARLQCFYFFNRLISKTTGFSASEHATVVVLGSETHGNLPSNAMTAATGNIESKAPIHIPSGVLYSFIIHLSPTYDLGHNYLSGILPLLRHHIFLPWYRTPFIIMYCGIFLTNFYKRGIKSLIFKIQCQVNHLSRLKICPCFHSIKLFS